MFVPLLAVLVGVTASLSTAETAAASLSELSIATLRNGDKVEIKTEKRFYRAIVVNPSAGETMTAVSIDGVNFSKPKKMFILGSTRGRPAGSILTLVRMGEIRRGWKLELGIGSLSQGDRVLSTPVKSVKVTSQNVARTASPASR